uniref:Uncharacterized protein n=1 Tax=Rhizophora mucronata TaxID=61149 RepID=A0A2P2N4S1_RHIMU
MLNHSSNSGSGLELLVSFLCWEELEPNRQ